MLIVELSDKGKVNNAVIFLKVHTKAPIENGMFLTITTSAMLARVSGKFDYEFTTPDADNGSFFIIYKEYLHKDVLENPIYINLRYNGSKFSADKIKIESKI